MENALEYELMPLENERLLSHSSSGSQSESAVRCECLPSTNRSSDGIRRRTDPISQAAVVVPRYASIKQFSPWFPECDPEHPRAQTWTTRLSDQQTALYIQLSLSIVVLGFNVASAAWALSLYGFTTAPRTIYEGDCEASNRYNTILHLLINAMSTLLLGASNYAAQILASPSRKDIYLAHSENVWLDVGVQSWRNILRIEWKRKILWIILMLSSIALHLFWNSALYVATPIPVYNVGIVTRDFESDASHWNTTLGSLKRMRESISSLEILNRSTCIDRYVDEFGAARNLLVVTNLTKEASVAPNSSLLYAFQAPDDGAKWYRISKWVCSDIYHQHGIDRLHCTASLMHPMASDWVLYLDGRSFPVSYCLSSHSSWQAPCSVRYNIPLLLIICGLSLCKCLCIGYLAFIHRTERTKRLITIGDAIASFLQDEDEKTKGMDFATADTFAQRRIHGACTCHDNKGTGGKLKRIFQHNALKLYSTMQHIFKPGLRSPPWQSMHGPRPLEHSKSISWFSASPRGRWVTTISSCSMTIGITVILLVLTITAQKRRGLPVDLSSLWNRGLGTAHASNVILPLTVTWTFYSGVAFANVFQIVLSTLYIIYNRLITTLMVADEWHGFGFERKTLRVSSPRGLQHSSYFLSLPYRHGVPLLIASSLLHWLISQSVFLVATAGYDADERRIAGFDAFTVGYSSIGIILTLVVGGAMVSGLAYHGFLKFAGDKAIASDDGCGDGHFQFTGWAPPLVFTCSAAISAACHRCREDETPWLFPVKWGEVQLNDDQSLRVCSFTTAWDVRRPQHDPGGALILPIRITEQPCI